MRHAPPMHAWRSDLLSSAPNMGRLIRSARHFPDLPEARNPADRVAGHGNRVDGDPPTEHRHREILQTDGDRGSSRPARQGRTGRRRRSIRAIQINPGFRFGPPPGAAWVCLSERVERQGRSR